MGGLGLVRARLPPLPSLLARLLPPGRAALAQRRLGPLHPVAGGALGDRVLRPEGNTHRAPRAHELPAQLRGHVLGQLRVGGPPATAVDDDVPAVRGALHSGCGSNAGR